MGFHAEPSTPTTGTGTCFFHTRYKRNSAVTVEATARETAYAFAFSAVWGSERLEKIRSAIDWRAERSGKVVIEKLDAMSRKS